MERVKLKVGIGSDHAAFERKNELAEYLTEKGYDVVDYGAFSPQSVDYSDIAFPLCEDVASGKLERGVLICGTGIGMCMSANKVKGIRCALCSEGYSARLTRMHNDTNVLALGARTTGIEIDKDILDIWLTTDFEGGRHQRRIDKLAQYENQR